MVVYPPATYARLAELKRRYDPSNLFHINHNIVLFHINHNIVPAG
jgi:hypothetical protein